MEKVIKIIKGNDSKAVARALSIFTCAVTISDIKEADIYTLHKGNLLLFRFIDGKKKEVRLFNTHEVEQRLVSLDGAKTHHV